jgi:acyl-CoA reductase-like NAD-dependent aldehyde dehydrogenase
MSTVEQSEQAAQADGASGNGAAAGTIPVENPATGEIIGHVPDLGADQVAEIVARARAAQPAWEALGFEGRAKVMYELRSWLVDNRERILRAVVEENGKTREDALLAELYYVADSIGFWARNAPRYLADERHRTHSPFLIGKKVITRYRPMGVVGVIAPWNYPLALGVGDALPALAAGNSVVLKPSEITPLATQLLIDEGLAAAGGPDGVGIVATGRGETGAALVDHADMIMFTGSTATGKKVMARAAETLTPVSLELGGKDPMIVCRDADLERAANYAVQWAMSNSGQICMSVERVYVEEPVYEDFVDRVVEKKRGLRQGVPGPGGSVEVGAMTFPPQVEVVERHVRDAVEKGARVVTGGRLREGPGRFYEPTVLTGVDHSMECMTEETFGPTLPIMKVRDEEEALRLANDTRYGLNSSVFTRDVEKGERIARRLSAGNVCVNDALMNYAAQEATFEGARESGLGARHGPRGIQKYCEAQTILVTRFGASREPAMFPNTPRNARFFERAIALMYGRVPRRYRTR